VPTHGHLPEGGPSRYLDILHATCESMRQHIDNPILTTDDVMLVEGIQAHLEDVGAHWNRLEAACEGAPKTLVHGDFSGKNVRLRSDNGHTRVDVFDWEDAGWGVPAVDLAQQRLPFGRLSANPDIPTYWSTVRERWPDASAEALHRLAYSGTVFRALAGLQWDVHNLAHEWAHDCVGNLQVYVTELDDALERLGWGQQ
jgi:aminoglycoside phosphotransferase (APT) family kinase protein